MQREEIERYLLAAAGHSIVVDARQDPRLPGLVRKVTIHNGYLDPLSVSVDWDSASGYLEYTEGEWGPGWSATYEALDPLIADLEVFLGPIAGWTTSPHQPAHDVRRGAGDGEGTGARTAICADSKRPQATSMEAT